MVLLRWPSGSPVVLLLLWTLVLLRAVLLVSAGCMGTCLRNVRHYFRYNSIANGKKGYRDQFLSFGDNGWWCRRLLFLGT